MNKRRYLVVQLPSRTAVPVSGMEHAVIRIEDDDDLGTIDCITWSRLQASIIAITFRRYAEAGVLP